MFRAYRSDRRAMEGLSLFAVMGQRTLTEQPPMVAAATTEKP